MLTWKYIEVVALDKNYVSYFFFHTENFYEEGIFRSDLYNCIPSMYWSRGWRWPSRPQKWSLAWSCFPLSGKKSIPELYLFHWQKAKSWLFCKVWINKRYEGFCRIWRDQKKSPFAPQNTWNVICLNNFCCPKAKCLVKQVNLAPYTVNGEKWFPLFSK